ncbi:MAG: nitroreductase family protein [Synergistaceae bacterium]|jgi:nitroreductase|nr:nitroreductase family protein [Synergistaceae bacterium]
MIENAAIKAILARRSIRRYENKPVEREKIDAILACAAAAPSANNFRPWHFIEVTDRKTLNALSDAHPYGKMLDESPLAVVVCAATEKFKTPDVWWEQDCGAAIQNILVAATALGLGSVWLGVHHSPNGLPDKIRAILGIPPHIQVAAIVAVGYGAETKPPYEAPDPALTHQGRW